MATATPTRAGHLRGLSRNQRQLTDEQVRLVLTSSMPAAAMAAEVGVSRQVIDSIRYGRTYQDVLPTVERWDPPCKAANGRGRTCWQCGHHSTFMLEKVKGSSERRVCCGLGLPDPLGREGARFARWCAAFIDGEQ